MATSAPPRSRPGVLLATATRGNGRPAVVLPALVAVVALVGGVLLLLGSHDRPVPRPDAVTPGTIATQPRLPVTRIKAGSGDYTLAVPRGMQVNRAGSTTRLAERSKRFAATIAPIATRDPALANTRVLRAMKKNYRSLTITSHGLARVDGHRAVASYGVAVTRKRDRVGFVIVSVQGARRSWTISSFATGASDSATILPRIRAIIGGFHLRR